MALIKCTECGNEISDKASTCPNCGCPVEQNDTKIKPSQVSNAAPIKKKQGGCGCCVFLLLCGIILIFINISNSNNNAGQKDTTSISQKYIDVTDAEAKVIDTVLSNCGITEITSFEHDELLDNAHSDGETGYRLAISNNVDNIILYLNTDKSVYSLRYSDNDLYVNGNVVATIKDYTITTNEASKLMITCEEKVKEVLKSPSTAKFPNILEWGFRKEKNIVTVQGYVDSQNSFGAEIRCQFQFIIDTNTNTIQSFIFDGQEMIQQ